MCQNIHLPPRSTARERRGAGLLADFTRGAYKLLSRMGRRLDDMNYVLLISRDSPPEAVVPWALLAVLPFTADCHVR